MLVQLGWSNERKTCLLPRKDIFTPTAASVRSAVPLYRRAALLVQGDLGDWCGFTYCDQNTLGRGDNGLRTSHRCPLASNTITSGRCYQNRRQPSWSRMAAGAPNYLLKAADGSAGSIPQQRSSNSQFASCSKVREVLSNESCKIIRGVERSCYLRGTTVCFVKLFSFESTF